MTDVAHPQLDPNETRNAREIAGGLLGSAARVGEAGVAWARLVGGVLVTAVWPFIHGINLLNLVPRAWATLVLGILAIAWSAFVLLRLRRQNPGVALPYISIAVDAILFNAMLLMFLLWPSEFHQSIVEVHGCSFVYLAIITAGIRFSPRAAYFGAALNSLFLVMLVACSTLIAGNLKIIGPAEWTTVAIGLIGSTVLAASIAGRTGELVQRSALETLMSQKAKSRLGAYVSREVADVVLQESELVLGGKRQQVGILFSDLRGFTRYSETLEPEQIVEQLNEYMSAMVETIAQHGGVVDKFMGDGIMAVFGAPLPRQDDADRAVECAQAMMRAIEEHNERRLAKGLPKLQHGIGVHYGAVIAGNVGTASRAAYTVIGDSVNLASRLEQMSKNTDSDMIVSSETLDACDREHALTYIDEVQVKGREQLVRIYGA